jgi:hypothetical protein
MTRTRKSKSNTFEGLIIILLFVLVSLNGCTKKEIQPIKSEILKETFSLKDIHYMSVTNVSKANIWVGVVLERKNKSKVWLDIRGGGKLPLGFSEIKPNESKMFGWPDKKDYVNIKPFAGRYRYSLCFNHNDKKLAYSECIYSPEFEIK